MTKPHNDKTTPRNGETTPRNGETTSHNDKTTSHNGETTTRNDKTTSHNDETTPRNGETTSHNGETTSYNNEWPHKKVMAFHSCALLMQYEHSKRHMNRRWWVRPQATQRRSQSQGFASNSVQELREEDEGRFHNLFRSLQYDILNITTTRPLYARNFRSFFDKFSLSTRTDEQILQCDNFFLATCAKAIMLAFEQVHLLRTKLKNSSLHTSK